MAGHLLSICLTAAAAAVAVPASAQDGEIGYPEGSLAYRTLLAADYALAERQLRTDSRVTLDDPAKLLNYGLALAKTGHSEAARRAFNRVLNDEEVELVMADGSSLSSHVVARRGLAMIRAAR